MVQSECFEQALRQVYSPLEYATLWSGRCTLSYPRGRIFWQDAELLEYIIFIPRKHDTFELMAI